MNTNIQNNTIIFTLNNTDIHHIYSAMTFSSIELLLNLESESARNFIEQSEYFTELDFKLLKDSVININNITVEMTLKQLIIFFACIDFICKMIIDEDETFAKIIIKAEPVEYESIKMKYLKFGTVATNKLKNDFKNNAGFMAAVKKITS